MRILILSILLSLTLSAQQIYVCKSVSDDGTPVEARNTWNVKPWGGTFHILLDNEGETIQDDIVYLFIDLYSDSDYEPFDSKVITITGQRDWVAYEYKFIELGEYEIYYMNSKQERIATEKVDIRLEETYQGSRKDFSTRYYDDADFVFCKRVIAGKPYFVKDRVSLSGDGGEVTVYLRNDEPLNTEKFLVDVWKKERSFYEYDQYVESKKYRLEPEWPDAFFTYKFEETGQYKVSVYTENEILIKSGYITVDE